MWAPRVAAAGRVRRELAELLPWAEPVETLAFQTEGRIGGKGENSIITCEGKIVLAASFVPTIYIQRIPNRNTSKYRNTVGGW